MTDAPTPIDPYKALRATLRPLRAMRYQWQGFLAVVTLVLAVAVYNFARLQGRVDVMEKEAAQLQNIVSNLKRDCEHITPARMLELDKMNSVQDREIQAIKKRMQRRR